MKKQVLLVILFSLFSNLYGQNDFSSLDFSFDYFSNTNTFGQFNQITKQPYYSPAVSYFDKSGFSLSVMSNFIENSDTSLESMTTEIDLNAGYDWSIGKYFSIYPSYTRYFYIGESNSLKSSFNDNFSLDLSIDILNIYAGANTSFLMGEENELFISAYLSYAFMFEEVFSNNSFLILQPEVNFNFGNQTYYSNYFWDNWKNDPEFRQKILENERFNNLINFLRNRHPELNEQQLFALLVARRTEEADEFNLSTIGLTLPMSIMIGNIAINSSFSTYFLTNKPDYIDEEFQTYFSIGFSYSFMWE